MPRRKFILEPLNITKTDEMKQVQEFKESLKFMSSESIQKIYKELDISNFYPEIVYQAPIGGRQIAKVTNNDTVTYFYKSSGTSRLDMGTENYWFPCMGDCSQPINPFTGKSERIRKLEDKYLDMEFSLLKEELKNNPNLMKYKRFITKENAMISKKLFHNQ